MLCAEEETAKEEKEEGVDSPSTALSLGRRIRPPGEATRNDEMDRWEAVGVDWEART